MQQVSDAQQDRHFALNVFLGRLKQGPMTVTRDSHIAPTLGISVTSRAMSSAVSTAIKNGWVKRTRSGENHDFYDNPIRYTITQRGINAVVS